jgi:hypothetical protein
MKYLVLTEMDLSDYDQMREKWVKIKAKAAKTGSARAGWTPVFPSHAMQLGQYNGVQIVEATEEGMIQFVLDYAPYAKVTYVPLFHIEKFDEMRQQMKQ